MKKLSDFDFSTNPFMNALSGASQGEVAGDIQQQEQGTTMPLKSEAPVMPEAAPQVALEETQAIPGQEQQGQGYDGLKSLISVGQNLQKFITESTDKNSVMLARGIMGAVGRLIAMGQEQQNQEVTQADQPAPLLNSNPMTPKAMGQAPIGPAPIAPAPLG